MRQWERDYVRKKYSIAMLGVEGIFFQAQNSKRLLVFFSSMGKDRFDRYSWYWEEKEIWENTSYLFIKDDTFHYFLGTDTKPMKDSISKVIKHHQELCNIDNNQTYLVGSSMGGYAAIYFAFYIKAKAAIVANPQVTLRAAQMHEYQNWERSIKEMGNQWYDLDIFSVKHTYKPAIYLEYGNYPADRKACESLVKSLLESQCLLIIRRELWSNHTVNLLSKSTIENALNFFESEPNHISNEL